MEEDGTSRFANAGRLVPLCISGERQLYAQNTRQGLVDAFLCQFSCFYRIQHSAVSFPKVSGHEEQVSACLQGHDSGLVRWIIVLDGPHIKAFWRQLPIRM